MPDYIKNYLLLIRFDKPVGTVLLLWPALWGLWVANSGIPNLYILIVFLAGVFLMRSAGCVINDIADRNFDGKVTRTQNRPLVTNILINKVSIKEAVYLFVFLCFLAFILVFILALSLNNINLIYHSFIALLLACIYPFCKRFCACPQFVLGLAFGYAIPMAFVASDIKINSVTWILYSASIIHSIIYDSFYAMADIQDDLKLNLNSSAIWFNKLFGNNYIYFILLLQVLFIINLLVLIYVLKFKIYIVFVFIIILLFYYQFNLAKTKLSSNCLLAFYNNNWVGFTVFVGFLIEYLIKN